MQVSIDDSLMELEENIFKVPQKRKRPCANTNSKEKDTLTGVSDAESDSNFSDSSATCSLRQSGFTSRIDSVEGITVDHFQSTVEMSALMIFSLMWSSSPQKRGNL